MVAVRTLPGHRGIEHCCADVVTAALGTSRIPVG